MLDIRRMRVLREVARGGSIAAAADALDHTPSAVSQQLSKLEAELGIGLLDRGPRSVRLTEAARVLAEQTDSIVARLAEAEIVTRELAGVRRLRVASIYSAAGTIVPRAVAALQAEPSGTEVTLSGADPRVSLDQVKLGELDIAVVFEYDFVPLVDDEDIARRLLLEEPLHVVLPPGHPAAAKGAVRLEELADDAWIESTPKSSCHPFTRRACRAAGFEPRVAARFDDYGVMAKLVAAGVGVAFAPELFCRETREHVDVRPIARKPPHRRIFVAYRQRDAASQMVQDFVDRLLDAAAEYTPGAGLLERAMAADRGGARPTGAVA